jgi:hypothetical protein
MRHFAFALAFLSIPAAALAQDGLPTRLRLYDPPQQDQEPAPPPAAAPDQAPVPVMEYVYRFSHLEGGVLFTHFDGDLDIEDDPGFYVRYGVGLDYDLSVHVEYRHYDFDNTELAGPADEHLLLRAALIGGGWRHAFTPEFAFSADLGVGAMWWDSQGASQDSDAGFLVSADAALTVRLHEALRLKLGVVADLAWTDFHNSSTETVASLSAILALELFGW